MAPENRHRRALRHTDGRALERADADALAPRRARSRARAARRRGGARRALRRLQYRLHTAGERVYGLTPPAGAELVHAELWDALAGARDMTSEIAEALEEDGPEAVGPLVHEWRGALFRVRLARSRLTAPRPPAEPEERGTPAAQSTARRILLVIAARPPSRSARRSAPGRSGRPGCSRSAARCSLYRP